RPRRAALRTDATAPGNMPAMTYARSLTALWLGASASAACASQVTPLSPDAAGRADTTAVGCGTFRDNTCPTGQFCFGPSACGSVWSCQRDFPCSAAIPSLACMCNGTVESVAAGCSERHAYRLGDAFGDAASLLEVGAPCDAARQPPFAVRVEVVGT